MVRHVSPYKGRKIRELTARIEPEGRKVFNLQLITSGCLPIREPYKWHLMVILISNYDQSFNLHETTTFTLQLVLINLL